MTVTLSRRAPSWSRIYGAYNIGFWPSFCAQARRFDGRHFLHDPEVYPDPNRFNPDRLISSPGKPAQRDPFEVSFGYGRRSVSPPIWIFHIFPFTERHGFRARSCPGSVLADYLLFIFCASILAVYDIEKVEENGIIQEPKHEFTSGVLVCVSPLPQC